MRFHCPNLPHTQLTKDYSRCAYTEKVRKFAAMMSARGHEVITYSNSIEQQQKYGFNGPDDYLKIDFNSKQPWEGFNNMVIAEIKKTIQPDDFICLITGTPAKPIADAFPDNIVVEYGVGYSGVFAPYRVFESYAWRNFVAGKHDENGNFFDEVIPNYFEVADFPPVYEKQDYYAFVGRLDANKGLNIAQQVCEKMGKHLKVAGPGTFSGYGEYVGIVDPLQRAELMGNATALFCPTMYIPPFEGVHIEAMLCGTPVITTDFGVFSETVENDFNGFRCKMFADFMRATEAVKSLSPQMISQETIARYSTDTVAKLYEQYFARLATLRADGWYSTMNV